jgi:hypothetical protein
MSQGQSIPRPFILKLNNSLPRQRLDSVYDTLIAGGFHVMRIGTPEEAINVARRCLPNLFLVNDDPPAGVDAVRWIERQHADPVAQLAVTPLIILAGTGRVNLLRAQEILNRIVVIARPPDPHNLVKTVGWLVDLWAAD